MWAGLAVGLVAVVLGFVKSGDCGSVFQPRDTSHDTVDALFGSPPPDCTQALDLTVPVIVLAVVRPGRPGVRVAARTGPQGPATAVS